MNGMRSGPASLVCNSRAAFAIGNRQSKIDNLVWGHSSVGRAPALQAGSQGFESPCLQSSLAAIASSEDCRAVALAKADVFVLAIVPQRALTRQARPLKAASEVISE